MSAPKPDAESALQKLARSMGQAERLAWITKRAGEPRTAMFNEAWIGLATLLAVAGLFTRQGALTLLAGLLFVIVGLSWLWNRVALARVEYERRFSESRAFAGETVEIALSLTNRKFVPLAWVFMDDRLPLKLEVLNARTGPSDQPAVLSLAHLTSARWFERVTWRYPVRCRYRGFYFLGPVRVRSGDIFGLFSSGITLDGLTRLIVYPRLIPLAELGIPGKHPFGERRARQTLFEDPSRTVGVREYHPDDPFRRIHWKATARHNQLQVRVLEPSVVPQLAIFLNVSTFEKHWHGTDTALLERMITVAGSIADHAARQRYAVGLIANGSVPHSDQSIKVMPGRDPNQLLKVLEALAAITGFSTAHFSNLLLVESSRLSWGATMVVITCVVSDELLGALARLSSAGRRVALVSLDSNFRGETVEGIIVHHLDPDQIDVEDPGVWAEDDEDSSQKSVASGQQIVNSER